METTLPQGISTTVLNYLIKSFIMSLVFDEYGRPFIILREQQEQARIKGLEAQKVTTTFVH